MSEPVSRQLNFNSIFDGGGAKKRKERPTHKGSTLLTAENNSQLFQVLGRDRISLAAGVAQLLDAPLESPNIWRNINFGIAYLVKDYRQKNYQLCMYDIFKKELQWSQTLCKNFAAIYDPDCPRLIKFDCDSCVNALRFSELSEAEEFKVAVEKRREADQKSHQQERRDSGIQTNHYQQQQHPVAITSTNMVVIPYFMDKNLHHLSTKKKTTKMDRDEKRRKVTKEDIGTPFNFVHKAHIGWDGNNGDPLDEKFLKVCQQIKEDLTKMDQDELNYALKFCADNEGKYAPPNETLWGNSQMRMQSLGNGSAGRSSHQAAGSQRNNNNNLPKWQCNVLIVFIALTFISIVGGGIWSGYVNTSIVAPIGFTVIMGIIFLLAVYFYTKSSMSANFWRTL